MATIDVPAQTCALHLAGGYVQRAGDPVTPVHDGMIDTASRPIAVELLVEPGCLYDPRGLNDVDGARAFGSGWWSDDVDVERRAVDPIEAERTTLNMNMPAQKINLHQAPNAAAFRVEALSGTLRTDAGDWSILMLGDTLTMSLGYGSYLHT